MTTSQLSELNNEPILYDDLSGIHPGAPSIALEGELAWISERLRVERPRIETFLAARDEIEQASLSGRYESAIESLDLLQKALGVTLWSVQLRLALEHQAGGLERQKKYSAEVRAVYRRGLLGFVTYHTSVRNEDRTTLAKFLDDIEGRIGGHQYYDDATKIYARYRLKNELPATKAELADILRTEQSHGIIDLYETFVAVLQHLVSQDSGKELAPEILQCIDTVRSGDFRLVKMALLLKPDAKHTLPARDRKVSDALLEGKVVEAARMGRGVLRGTSPVDPWQLAYLGFAFAHSRRARSSLASSPTRIVQMIGRVQSRCDVAVDAWSQVAKLVRNFRGLPVAAGILEILQQLRRARPDAPWRPWLVGLNSRTVGIEDDNWSGPIKTVEPRMATWEFWCEVFEPTAGGMAQPAILSRAAGHLHRQEYEVVSNEPALSDENEPEPLRSLQALFRLHALFARGDRQKVIALIADEGTRSRAHRQFLPLASSLKGYSWPDYKVVAEPLAAPIALHLLWSVEETSAVASQLRFATGAELRKAGTSLPSELVANASRYRPHQLIYFLDRVCVPNILDLSRLFRGSREIMEERRSICHVLADIDPANADQYQDESLKITNQLTLDEGQRIVDSTRIHVDGDALTRWAVRSLSEDYDRYRDLASVVVKGPQSYDDVLRELNEGSAQRAAFSPDNEADAVVLSIIGRVAEEFLTNATFGLDYYLSQRVRHQSFIGLIRGPLEFANLITTKESEGGDYHRNDVWVDSFHALGVDERGRIDLALKRFAARFDETLIRAKDAYFHLWSTERPQGISLLLSERLLAVTRTVLQLDLTFGEFLRFLIPVLWAALEPSLQNVRRLITEDIKAELIKEFDHVRAAVRQIAENDPSFLKFDAAMGNVSAEVQVKLDEAAQWFVHADNAASVRRFTLSQILAIGLSSALKTQRGYDPVISQVTEGSLELLATDLVFIHDVLIVGLGNVHKHSGLKTPKIDIVARWNEQNSTLAISITSDCRPSNRSDKEKQADVSREHIAAGTYSRRTRVEGGSGFAKLAAVVGQSNRAKLEFGFTGEGRFELEVTYAVDRPAMDGTHDG